MKKLFYILPEYSADTSMHFRYNVELLDALAETFEVCLFVEKGEAPVGTRIQHVKVARFSGVLRFVERFFVFGWARLKGYRNFYSHYGYLSALIASFWGRLYFWHCEMRGNYEADCSLCNVPAKLMRDWPFRLILWRCFRLVTCTERMKKYYVDVFGVERGKIKVVGNWVDVEALKMDACEKKTPTLLFVHWLSPRKGSRVLPELFERVKEKLGRVNFVVVGDGPDFKWLQREFKKRGLKVDMRGAVPNVKVRALYGAAHVLLHPSREEEFGRVLIEAMAAGLPVVATRTFGAESILSVKQKKFMFDYEDLEAGAKLCAELLASEKKRAALRREGFEVVKAYDKAAIVSKFARLF